MAAVSEPFETIAAPLRLRLAGLANWAVLWLIFVVAGAILGCVAATHRGSALAAPAPRGE